MLDAIFKLSALRPILKPYTVLKMRASKKLVTGPKIL